MGWSSDHSSKILSDLLQFQDLMCLHEWISEGSSYNFILDTGYLYSRCKYCKKFKSEPYVEQFFKPGENCVF